jgi:glutaredoxin 3
MYTQAFCGYCAAARSLLDKKKVTYDEIDITLNAKLRREMTDRSGKNTVPQIFIDNRCIGGYDELSALDREGKLDALLERSE